ncbi:MAG: CBS domain-containing protein, partial [Thermodesulfobacteriota bacterium]|nr:CBS domain-containing protein [Thermodesulfobacteriota bacterium]
PAEEYMSTDFAVVSPDTPLLAIQKIIVGNNQRFVPVVEKGKIIGGITRTDLLRVMQSDLMKKPSYLYSSGHDPRFTRKKSVYKLMKERLDKRIFETLQALGKKADALHYNAYLTGGIVRDLILRRENLDVDIVVEGDGIELAKQFSKDCSCKVKSYKKFGTATLIFPDGFRIDIATARLEYYESPAALPTVEHSSIKLDLYRRDFTMNTLAIRLNPAGFGELIDFFGGQKDIKERMIRVIHNLSFVEDPTRIFRAIRFEQRFGFHIGRHTIKLIKNAVKMNFLDQLDGYRFFSELVHIFEEEEPIPVIKRLVELDILRFIHPRIQFNEKKKKTLENIRDVISWYDLLFLEEKYEKWLIYFSGLVDSLNKQEIREVCKRLSMTEKNEKRVIKGIQEAESTLRRIDKSSKIEKSAIYRILKPLPTETLLYSMAQTDKKHIRKAISIYFTQLKSTKLHINGENLKSMGITPGIIFKEIMDALMEAKLDGRVETKEDEIKFVKENFIGAVEA